MLINLYGINLVENFCSNYKDFNGTIFGKFKCPLTGFRSNEKECCGNNGTQFCCQISERYLKDIKIK